MTSRSSQRGFSFIEILIVMGIISVLVGGVIVAIGMWTEKGPEFATKNTITKTKALIEDWERLFSSYPPMEMDRIATVAMQGDVGKPDNDVNAGIEAVYQALHWPGFRGSEFTEEELSNTDDDKLKKRIGKATADLKEIRDAWGNPLIYFHRDAYGKAFDAGASYWNSIGDTVEAKPYKQDDGINFVNQQSFQLFSMGPDGIPNNDDDILPWK